MAYSSYNGSQLQHAGCATPLTSQPPADGMTPESTRGQYQHKSVVAAMPADSPKRSARVRDYEYEPLEKRPCHVCSESQIALASVSKPSPLTVANQHAEVLTQSMLEQIVSPENANFASDLRRYGLQIRNYLEPHINTPHAERSCPMPGMAHFVAEVGGFIKQTVLNDAITEQEKELYTSLLQEFCQLKEENYPWNKSFTLFIKCGLYISFYHYDKNNEWPPGDNSRKELMFQQIKQLPWDKFLGPEHPYWGAAFYPIRDRLFYTRTLHVKLKEHFFYFPQLADIGIDFFNDTWLLNIHPVGFFYKTAKTNYDGISGTALEFQDHDLTHSYRQGNEHPWSSVPYQQSRQLIANTRDHGTICQTEHSNQCVILTESKNNEHNKTGSSPFSHALELVLFTITHEDNNPVDFCDSMEKATKLKEKIVSYNGGLRENFRDVPPVYHQLSRGDIESALIFLLLLSESNFWVCGDVYFSKKCIKQAIAQHQLIEEFSTTLTEIDLIHLYPGIATLLSGKSFSLIPYQDFSGNTALAYIDNGKIIHHPKPLSPNEIKVFINESEAGVVLASDQLYIQDVQQCRIIPGVKHHSYHQDSGLLIIYTLGCVHILFLKSSNPAEITAFNNHLDCTIDYQNKIMRFYLPNGMHEHTYSSAGFGEYRDSKNYGSHMKAVNLAGKDLSHLPFGHASIEACDFTGSHPPPWHVIAHASFTGYCPFSDINKLAPVISAAQAWFDQSSSGCFSDKVQHIKAMGLLPFLKLTSKQLQQLIALSPWADSQPLAFEHFPFRAVWNHPEQVPKALLLQLQNHLQSPVVCLRPGRGQQLENNTIKALIDALDSAEDVRKFVRNNYLPYGRSFLFQGTTLNAKRWNSHKQKTNIDSINFDDADLSGCHFQSATIINSSFVNANLCDCHFINSELQNNIFTRTNPGKNNSLRIN